MITAPVKATPAGVSWRETRCIASLLILICMHCVSPKHNYYPPQEVYKSNSLIITQVSKNTFQHTTFKQTNDFGNVPCNGLVIKNNEETIVFDTPTTDEGSEELIKWIKETLHCKINAVVPTHFHDDCLGGLQAFHKNRIPSYANFKTIELAEKDNLTPPQNGFNDSLSLKVGAEKIIARFAGEGHTKDNIVGYFAAEDVMFGGCLIKEIGAGKGYLGDANLAAWSATVKTVKKEFPNVKVVVPGHGKPGNQELLDYTIQMFRSEK